MLIRSQIWAIEEETPFIDTHEHLIEEARCVRGNTDCGLLSCDDWALLFNHYLANDLISARKPVEDHNRLFAPETASEDKYRLIAPWWDRTRHTGYA